MAEHVPPPTYSQQDPVTSTTPDNFTDPSSEPQILLIPSVDAVNFQKGFLGADGERAAIEGELQIKGVEVDRWDRLTVSLRSFESAYEHDVELAFHELELWKKDESTSTFPTSLPFSIPLLPDTPQSIQTPHSILAHTLNATLYPADDRVTTPISKNLIVHTRRYTSHSNTLAPSPEIHSLEDPTHVDVQVARTAYTSGEAIPLYVTVPPPSRETVVHRGLRLRNVRAELIRVVKVKREHMEGEDSDEDSDAGLDDSDVFQGRSTLLDPPPARMGDPPLPSSSKMPLSPLFLGSSYRAVIARSGASCRFHSSRPIQLRFVLHQNSSSSPSDSRTNLDRMESDIESALVTQITLLHSISFHIKVHISFVDTSTQTERVSTIIVPVTILPPHAPLPEVSRALDDAYQKKHDRPPTRTVREDEVDPNIPHYSEGEAGPSMPPAGAPPPFEERDAPPPFFSSAHEASSSSRLPTFQESESEVILPDSSHLMEDVPTQLSIPGEGTIFGFRVDQQFDGHADDLPRSHTPPPTLEMAARDTDLTPLADGPNHVTLEALNLVLDHHEDTVMVVEDHPPPPPPAMDDPSDPPPSIDSDFRSPPRSTAAARQASPIQPDSPVPYHGVTLAVNPSAPAPAPAPQGVASATGAAPPPYLNPEAHRTNETDSVTRPPPYAD
ncbi:hypothetical protein CPB83DRAFT_56597 [Crepidotus variabilis]|uniref:Uncharacterized protein n=1 Tax=Crepidotus variabilis TaxID=179855 RepID=A0A9P6ELN8_9AGAR|nr:hypothetical protein CPB83DRAFT_56597 [Crepidotus variabilis]